MVVGRTNNLNRKSSGGCNPLLRLFTLSHFLCFVWGFATAASIFHREPSSFYLGTSYDEQIAAADTPPQKMNTKMSTITTTTPDLKTTVNTRALSVETPDPSAQRSFYEIARKTGSDKVQGQHESPQCETWGHYYHSLYQKWLGPYSTDSTPPFQFLEIGFFNGQGFDAYRDFFPTAEHHSMEISCIEKGSVEEGKWPWGNFAEKNANYQKYLDSKRLHCGDASDVNFLHKIWTTEMKRPDAPPLKVVVDDGAHVAAHMTQSVFFWFPRIAPRGLMIIEDVQAIDNANKFRTDFLPQLMADVHSCGKNHQNLGHGRGDVLDEPCFPTLKPFLFGIHCELHICIIERNDKPAVEPSLEESTLPKGALDLKTCKQLYESKGQTTKIPH